ncbi:pah4 homeobox protein encoded by the pah4 protein [Diplogelasinospora grovesii]|uniref:Pah4 homeobox protein encoded by the pah4 protein n=1 Tax=Diplogelasinospora grovesii TaxID=303347 RepID=A0AAN6S6V0_9PEZI|nr:pah4 homeobox protein encoded by the pah4 protein [Diplogelasinospora grovesii]
MDPQTPSPSSSFSPFSQQSQDNNNAEEQQHPSSPLINAEGASMLTQSSSPNSDAPKQQSGGELERHPKGKRKRTAAKDKAILEAAYNANAKPDKAARLDIVKRVSLNEKEVQIWFQNRRQNDRRKSRPLSPEEIAALRYGGMQMLSSDPLLPHNHPVANNHDTDANCNGDASLPQLPEQPGMSPPPFLRSGSAASNPSSDEAETDKAEQKLPSEARPHTREGSVEGSNANLELAAAAMQRKETSAVDATPQRNPLSQSFSSSIGYLSNRWNTSSFSTPATLSRGADDSFKLDYFPPSTSPCAHSSGSLPPPSSSQSSQIRLSLSLEGKAEVVATVPSPPRLTPPRPSAEELQALGAAIRRPSLQRSHSASPVITLPPISLLTNSLPVSSPSAATTGKLPPRLTRGRSRDVHAWEFCCDAESREDPLITQAKHESSGSAIAAISLLRSTSASASTTGGGSPLQPSGSAKRNATVSKVAAPRGERLAKKPRLFGRAYSSVARLQTDLLDNDDKDSDKVAITRLMSPSGGGADSDKENWSPDEEGNPQLPLFRAPQRRPLPSSSGLDKRNARRRGSPGRVLHEQRSLFGHARSNTAPWGSVGLKQQQQQQQQQKRGQTWPDIYEDNSENNEREESSPARRRPAAVPTSDDEVERFMRGEVSPSKKGDVDAVAGLLSLSQGNWR